MDLMLWFDDFKENAMYRAWNRLAEQGHIDGYETIHRHQLYRRPWRHMYKYMRNRDWIWMFSGQPYEASIIPISASVLFKEKTIFFASTPFWDDPATASRTGFSKRAWKFYLENSEVVMATEASRHSLENSLDIESRVIPHAVDTSLFRPCNDVDRRDDVVLFVGRLIEKKGVLQLLEIAARNPDVEFWFCGEGDLKKEIENAANRDGNVRYFGFVESEEKLAKIYTKSALLVLPSIRSEGNDKWEEFFGRVITEALACETPVVASAHSGPRSIVTPETGITISQLPNNRLNQEVFETKIRNFLNDDEKRRSMGKAGRQYCKDTFDIEVVSKQWLDLFASV